MDIKRKLEGWGRWACGRLGTEYPAVAAGMLPAVSERFHIPLLSEAEALEMEQIILLIRPVEPKLYEIILLHYGYRKPVKEICQLLGIKRTRFWELLSTADTSVRLMLTQRKCVMLA